MPTIHQKKKLFEDLPLKPAQVSGGTTQSQQQPGLGDMAKNYATKKALGKAESFVDHFASSALSGITQKVAPTVASGIEGGAVLAPTAGAGGAAGLGAAATAAAPWLAAGVLGGKALGLFNEGGNVDYYKPNPVGALFNILPGGTFLSNLTGIDKGQSNAKPGQVDLGTGGVYGGSNVAYDPTTGEPTAYAKQGDFKSNIWDGPISARNAGVPTAIDSQHDFLAGGGQLGVGDTAVSDFGSGTINQSGQIEHGPGLGTTIAGPSGVLFQSPEDTAKALANKQSIGGGGLSSLFGGLADAATNVVDSISDTVSNITGGDDGSSPVGDFSQSGHDIGSAGSAANDQFDYNMGGMVPMKGYNAGDWVGNKTAFLIKNEGKSPDQAYAIAMNMAKKYNNGGVVTPTTMMPMTTPSPMMKDDFGYKPSGPLGVKDQIEIDKMEIQRGKAIADEKRKNKAFEEGERRKEESHKEAMKMKQEVHAERKGPLAK